MMVVMIMGGGSVGDHDDDNDDDDENDNADGDDDNNDDDDKYDDGDDGGGGGVGDDDDNDNDDNDGDDLASLYRHAQKRGKRHIKRRQWHTHSVITLTDQIDSIKSQFAVFIYIYLVLKKLVIRLSVDLTYVFHNTKQI